MRESLKAVLSRVDRLIDRVVVRPEDWAARLRFMSDLWSHCSFNLS